MTILRRIVLPTGLMVATAAMLFSGWLRASAPHFPTASTAVAVAAPVADTVIARGKGFTVRQQKLAEAWDVYVARMSRGGQLPDESRASVESKLLGHIIDTEILLCKATPEERKSAEAATEQIMTDGRKRFASDDDFTAWLKAMGMSPAQYRLRTTQQNISEQVIDRELKPVITISEAALQKYYDENAPAFDRPEQVRGRQILWSTADPETHQPLSPEKKLAKKKLADAAKARLAQGEDFLMVAREFSEEPWAKVETEGDEMLYVRGQFPKELDAVVFALKLREISGVLESPTGYHIFRITEHQPASRLPLAAAAPRLREFLVNEEIKKHLPEYLTRLKLEAAVEIVTATTASAGTPKP